MENEIHTKDDKLNICITTDKFSQLGRTSEHGLLWPISKALVQMGHSVTVLARDTTYKEPEIVLEGVHAHFLKNPTRILKNNHSPYLEKFKELHSKKPFQVVHSLDSSGLPIAESKHQLKVATAFDVNSLQLSQLFAIVGMNKQTLRSLFKTAINLIYKFLRTYWGQDRKLLSVADGVFVSSPLERITLERYYYYPDSRIHTLPYGVEIHAPETKRLEELRKKWNLNSFNQCIVTLSDMEETADMQNILLAFEKVVIKKPDLRLIILGNGPRRKEIEYNIYNLALGNKVILTGAVTNEEIPDYIALCDVFININPYSTGFEPSLLEAMMLKKVVIGSEISPLSAIVEDTIDGFLIRPADVASMSDLLMDIFYGRIDIKSLGERAHKKVSDLVDIRKMVGSTLEAYKKLVGRRGI